MPVALMFLDWQKKLSSLERPSMAALRSTRQVSRDAISEELLRFYDQEEGMDRMQQHRVRPAP